MRPSVTMSVVWDLQVQSTTEKALESHWLMMEDLLKVASILLSPNCLPHYNNIMINWSLLRQNDCGSQCPSPPCYCRTHTRDLVLCPLQCNLPAWFWHLIVSPPVQVAWHMHSVLRFGWPFSPLIYLWATVSAKTHSDALHSRCMYGVHTGVTFCTW